MRGHLAVSEHDDDGNGVILAMCQADGELAHSLTACHFRSTSPEPNPGTASAGPHDLNLVERCLAAAQRFDGRFLRREPSGEGLHLAVAIPPFAIGVDTGPEALAVTTDQGCDALDLDDVDAGL